MIRERTLSDKAAKLVATVRGEKNKGWYSVFFAKLKLSHRVVTPSNAAIVPTAGTGYSPPSGQRRGYRGAADPSGRSGGKKVARVGHITIETI